MVKLIKKAENNNMVSYEYYPEDKNDSGVISFNKDTLKANIEKLAEADEFSRYAFHAIRMLKMFAEKGVYEEKSIVAWY